MKLNNIKYKYGIFKIRFTKSFDVTFLLSYYTESYQTNRRGRFQDLFTFPEKKNTSLFPRTCQTAAPSGPSGPYLHVSTSINWWTGSPTPH